jgi:phosphoribosylamine--glycine ligase
VALALPAARDHKRLGDGDTGPNTGGMGAYSPLPDLDEAAAAAIVARFHRPALAELARRGTPFRGALYAGLMLTADGGPVLLEFNARFGDPETQAILPRLDVPLAPFLLAAARGELATAAAAAGIAGDVLPGTAGAAVAIVLASGRYPDAPGAGDPIAGLDAAAAAGALVFHAGTRRSAAGGWETDGGRVLAVVGRGPDLAGARAAAERAADLVSFPGARRRRDIAVGAIAAGAVPVAPPRPGAAP